MPYVLAIEPDPRQAAVLRRLVCEQVGASFVLADSRDATLSAIDQRVPDLLLVTTLLSPRDEAEITEHLKTLTGAGHLQTLTIPLLAAPATPKESLRGRMLGAFKRRKPASIEGCDPKVFGDQIATYLQRALELKAEQSQRAADLREAQPRPEEPPRSLGAADPQAVLAPHAVAEEPVLFAGEEEKLAVVETQVPAAVEQQALAGDEAHGSAGPPHSPVVAEEPTLVAAEEEKPAVVETQVPAAVEQQALACDEAHGSAEPPDSPAFAEPSPPGLAEQRLAGHDVPAVADEGPTPDQSEPDRVEARPASEVPPSEPSDRPVPLLDRARLLPCLAPLERFLAQHLSTWRGMAMPRCLLAERSVVEASETLAVTPSGVVVPVPVSPCRPPAPSPWDELFHALEQHFARDEEKWTDLTPLLETLEEGAGPGHVELEPAAANEESEPATEAQPVGLQPHAGTERADSAGADLCPATDAAGPTMPEPGLAARKPDRRRKRRRRARRHSLAEPLTPVPGVDSLWVANAIAALRLDIERLRLEATSPVVSWEHGLHAPGVPPANKASSPSRNDPHRPNDGEARTRRPPQDEWGLYDPEQCGIAALMARLDEQPATEAVPRPATPADGEKTPRAAEWGPPAEPPREGERVAYGHLSPLSIWAHMDASGEVEAERQMALHEPLAHLPALMTGLRLPEHVASVRYGSGCRIHRVRVADRPRRPDGDQRQPIILSRKALRELRSER